MTTGPGSAPGPAPAPRRRKPGGSAALGALRLGWLAAPWDSAASLAVTVAQGLLPAASAWTAKLLLDDLAEGGALRVGRAEALVVLGALLACVSAVLGLAAGQLARRIQRSTTLRAQSLLYERVNAFPGIAYFEDPAFQDRIRLAEQGAQNAPGVVARMLTETVRGAVVVAGYLGALMIVWPPLAVLPLAAAIPGYLAQRVLARRRAETTESTIQAQRRRFFFQQLLTDATAAKEVRLFGLGGLFHGRLLKAFREGADADLAVEASASRVQAALAGLTALVAVGAGLVAVRGVADGRVTVGGFMLCTAALGGVQSALGTVIAQASDAGRALRLFEAFREVMDAPQGLRTGTAPVPPLRHGIEFRDVWFRYHPDDPWVLRGAGFLIPVGESVGLVGRNGAGKSTLVKLLCRFYEPERGQILWDGVDVAEFCVEALRERIGATFQDFCRYDATAAENVGVGDLARLDDRAAIRRAAEAAGADETLAGLRDGYDTFLSRLFHGADLERGTALSGGQWQRVALARSLMRQDTDLLILDEPSSGLDPEAEQRVHQTLARHREGRTSLLISHRLSALRGADTILVLRDGHIVEKGTHEELMDADSEYAELFLTQAAGYRDEPVGSAS